MFEEICLVCGKHLPEDGRAYCSDDCQHSDLSSPSISSSSSALSSPSMGYAAGGDVPALMPSALGNALQMYVGRGGQYISSSASSTSWSVLTDEEDEDATHRFGRNEYGFHDTSDAIYDSSSKSPNFIYAINSAALSYARRPSGTNNPSTAPHLHRRLSSGSSSEHVRGIPRSAPGLSHVSHDDDDSYSDFGFLSRDALDIDDADLHSEKDWGVDIKPKYPGATKSKRSRNRASLPACFSLLQMSSPKKDSRASPVSSSSGNTIARPSPPTPKLPISNVSSQVEIVPSFPLPSVHSTPRGRRREADKSRSSKRSGHSSASRSYSRARRTRTAESPRLIEGPFVGVKDGNEGFDWSSSVPGLPRRGREAIRRNSSPPPKMLMGMEEPTQAFTAVRRPVDVDRSRSGGDAYPKTRGRARVEDLGGVGLSSDAPGYGNGRSGLIHRERGAGSHVARVPL
ncbi:hypothetical protein BDZ97DRAFT_1904175 [Flammula alnicola]|nr:hypothetical protein BDZ97DRAFT_1904175 [Flammula alnicola]